MFRTHRLVTAASPIIQIILLPNRLRGKSAFNELHQATENRVKRLSAPRKTLLPSIHWSIAGILSGKLCEIIAIRFKIKSHLLQMTPRPEERLHSILSDRYVMIAATMSWLILAKRIKRAIQTVGSNSWRRRFKDKKCKNFIDSIVNGFQNRSMKP